MDMVWWYDCYSRRGALSIRALEAIRPGTPRYATSRFATPWRYCTVTYGMKVCVLTGAQRRCGWEAWYAAIELTVPPRPVQQPRHG